MLEALSSKPGNKKHQIPEADFLSLIQAMHEAEYFSSFLLCEHKF